MSAASVAPGPPGRAARLRGYLREMYPPPARLALAAALAASLAAQLARLHGQEPRLATPATLLATAATFVFLLVLRLMDELKDVEVDRALFPQRPLPAGRVLASDLTIALIVCSGLFLLLHLGSPVELASGAATLGYALLMFRWFFLPGRMRPDLWLTLATHQPIVPLLLVDLLLLLAVASGEPPAAWRLAPLATLVAALWAALLGWEITRKIRAPRQEDAYVTYSRLLGARAAVALAAGAQLLALALWLGLWARFDASPAALLLAGLGTLVALVGHGRFLAAPGPRTARLRPFAEAHVFSLLLAGVLA